MSDDNLDAIINKRLSRKKIVLDSDAKELLESRIQAGIVCLTTDGARRRQEARENAHYLAGAIIGAATDPNVTEESLRRLLRKLCPIYPFCSTPQKAIIENQK